MSRIVVDIHEEASGIPEILERFGLKVEYSKLTVADYVVSEECGIERKRAQDYLSSLFRRRLFDQLKRLSDAYSKPILIVEGDLWEEIRGTRIRPEAIWGSLVKISVEYGVSVFHTTDKWESAKLIRIIHNKEEDTSTGRNEETILVKEYPRKYTSEDRQIMILSSLPGVGPEIAKRMLENFGSLRRIFSLRERDLVRINGIGKKKAREIVRLMDYEYKGKNRRYLV